MNRTYTICTEHLIVIKDTDKGECPECKGDRNLIGVVASADLQYVYCCPKHGVNTLKPAAVEPYKLLECGAVSGYGDVCKLNTEVILPWASNITYSQRQW